MALDIYNHFLNDPRLKKLVGNDYMFVEYRCPIDSEKFKLWTDTPFLNYVITGRKDWTAIEKTYELKQGDSVFIKRGVYNTKQYFDVEYCTLLFFVTDDFVRRFFDENKGIFPDKLEAPSENQIYEVDVNESLSSLFLAVFNYLNHKTEIPKNLVEMKFKELLYNITLNPTNKNLVEYFNSLKQIEKTNINDVMMKNFHSDLKLDEYARLCGRSLSTFKRDFQNYYKETPGKWLNNKRLEYSKSLLENKELNIEAVCFESGFKNTSHFNSAFKEKYKLPPNQYRKVHLQKTI